MLSYISRARSWFLQGGVEGFYRVRVNALAGTPLKAAARIDVVDFGSGKGYLTFAMHDYLRSTLGLPAQVAGVELRPDMVALCNAAVQRLGSARTSIYSHLVPVAALVTAAVWLGEPIGGAKTIGALLVIGGLLTTRIQRPVMAPPAEE